MVLLGFFIDFPVLALIGFAVMFLSGLMMFNAEVEYKTGEITDINESGIYVYGDNYSGYHYDRYMLNPPNPATNDLNLFHTNRSTTINATNIYTTLDDSRSHMIGVFLAVISVIGFAFTVAFEIGRVN